MFYITFGEVKEAAVDIRILCNDDCSFSYENDFNHTTNADDTYLLGKTEVQWTATDGSGNTSVLTQNVYVASEAEFSITCPQPTSLDLGYNPEIDDFVEELAQVNKALERIESGEYLNCAACGEDIGEERLMAIPYTDSCIKCAS